MQINFILFALFTLLMIKIRYIRLFFDMQQPCVCNINIICLETGLLALILMRKIYILFEKRDN